jgi:predicted KAP-like P-loop ATPase
VETILIVILVGIALLALLFKGVIKTFKRQPVVAILLILFLFPVYLIWAFVELFTDPIEHRRGN